MTLDNVLTVDVLKWLLPALGAAALFVVRKIKKDKAATWESIFREGVEVAYHMVDDLSKQTATPIDDKVALALGILNEFLQKNGQPPMKSVDEERAKMLFSAMHGMEKR